MDGFIGYDFLLRLVGAAGSAMMKAFVALLFETGGRVSEVLGLRKSDFSFPDAGVILVTMPVGKRFDVVGKVPSPDKASGFRWMTRKRVERRVVPVLRKSPLAPFILDYTSRLAENQRLFPFTRRTALNRIRAIGRLVDPRLELYPHWFRAQKATELASRHGFDSLSLQRFFAWKSMAIVEQYARLDWRDLVRRMGGEV